MNQGSPPNSASNIKQINYVSGLINRRSSDDLGRNVS